MMIDRHHACPSCGTSDLGTAAAPLDVAALDVFVVMHNDYDWRVVRGVYATRLAAEEACKPRVTPSGRRSRAIDSHSPDCCEIEEHELLALSQPVPEPERPEPTP